MKTRLYLSLFFILALTLATAFPSFGQGNIPNRYPSSTVITASSQAESKISAALLEEIQSAVPGSELHFIAHIVAGTDLSQYTESWFARPFVDPLGTTAAVGIATSSQLVKMAADPNVILLQGEESLIQAPPPASTQLAELQASKLNPAINTDPNASPGPAPAGWYHTTPAVHGSTLAWEKGYTGSGVRLMSNDSGADYCHPDLQGTYAYIDDPYSPYYGLPEMFDSLSSYVAAYDYYMGTGFIAAGFADYADTSATTGGNFSYAPLGAAQAHNYTVTGTSLSGVYHYGSHPDTGLASYADIISAAFGDGTAVSGERAAILVADEVTPGVYDTVYVTRMVRIEDVEHWMDSVAAASPFFTKRVDTIYVDTCKEVCQHEWEWEWITRIDYPNHSAPEQSSWELDSDLPSWFSAWNVAAWKTGNSRCIYCPMQRSVKK